MRQNAFNLGHKGITLSDQEMIDNSNWEELLKQNREKYCKYK